MSPADTISVPSPEFLYFRQASVREKLICWNRNSASWGGLLNLPDYLGRETLNGSQLMTRDGQIKYWVLSSLDKPPAEGEEEPDTIYAACETLQKPVIVKTKDGDCTEEISYGIASVYTNPKCRRKGVASVLLARLAKWLDTEGNCRVSALYSDVGKDFYAVHGGWMPYSSNQLTVSISPSETKYTAHTEVKTKPLQRADLKHLCKTDQDTLKSQFQSLALPPDTHARFTFLPTFAQACWHFGTEEYICEKVLGKSPMVKGALVDNNTWLYWTHDFAEKKLVVLRVVASGDKEGLVARLKGLLSAAEKEAREWEFGKIVAWSPIRELVEAAELLEKEERGIAVDVADRENDRNLLGGTLRRSRRRGQIWSFSP
ncbi:uncharacterized protein LAJ45_05094 [Morchella importuna]|uniref:uncharacterized protein n=1 Tax=Morchella importuna TaxID=1174673 RepID=UPI001E8D3F72|nr:uncharacterized protein LAJ45_05094 [Morchella importuna]KAH8150912.1 hypothetical protein LAJ45_05094 [Morchella importuna]